MSTQSNAVTESAIARPAAAVTAISPWRRFYWSVRRELWENRSLYVAPVAVAAFVILGVLIAVLNGKANLGISVTENGITKVQVPAQQVAMLMQNALNMLFQAVSGAIMGVTLVVAAVYCLGTLHGERRDRSILFWKSLPVSDTTAVLGKAAVPFVVLPIVMIVLVMLTDLVIMLIVFAGQAAHGQGVAWPDPGLLQTWGMTLFHIVAIHALWYAPLYCYMLMVSAWARRAPFLWAVVPPVVLAIVEKIAFGTSYIFSLLQDRFTGASSGAVDPNSGMGMDSMHPLALQQFLTSPGLWIGLAVAAILLVATVRLRRAKGLI